MNLAYKYKLLPTKLQSELLLNHMFVSHQTYNILLSLKEQEISQNKINKENNIQPEYYSNTQLDNYVKDILNNRELSFNTKVIQQERIRFNRNYQANIKKIKNGNNIGKLKYKKYSRTSKQSLQTTKEQYKIKDHSNPKYKILKLFRNEIKIRWTRNLPSQSKSITISFDGNDFWIVFNVSKDISNNIDNLNNQEINENINNKIGIDLNNSSIDLGNENLYQRIRIEQLKDYKYLNDKKKKYERQQSKRILKAKKKKEKVSKRYYKTQKKINKIYRKIKNKREYKLHQYTNNILNIINENNINNVIVEDLNVKAMTNSKNVNKFLGKKKTKSMRKNILNISYSNLLNILEYKCVQFGKVFKKVNPKNTSKQCSSCGKIKEDLKLSDRQYICECGLNIQRDYNACLNIQNRVETIQ